nr:ORF I polyprotein [Ipomoea batatas]
MGVAVEFQQASLGYLSVSGENATQQRHGEASSHLPVSPASPSSTTEREWTSTPRRQFVELGDGRQQQREGSSSQSTSNADFPPDIDVNQFPWSHEYLEERRTDWEVRLFRYHGGHMLQPYGIHPKYPFAQIFIAQRVTAWVSRFLEGHVEPFMKIYEQHMESIMVQEEDYPELQRYIFAQNKVIPKEIWPREGIQPDIMQDDEIYYERIKSARNQYYYELNQAKKGEDIWSQDPWNFDDIDAVLEEVEKIEKAYAHKSRKKRPEDKSQWNKDVWRTKRRQSGMNRQEWVNYMGYPSYSSYSTESDTASDEDSVMDLQFRGEWMIMKANQPGWNPQNWKGKRFMNEG